MEWRAGLCENVNSGGILDARQLLPHTANCQVSLCPDIMIEFKNIITTSKYSEKGMFGGHGICRIWL